MKNHLNERKCKLSVMMHKGSDVGGLSSLVLWYQQNKDPYLLDIICERATKTIDAIVRRRPHNSSSYDDMFSDGYKKLPNAVLIYSPQKGHKFETYFGWVVHRAIQDGWRERDHLPRPERRKLKKLGEAIGFHEGSNGQQTYTLEELAKLTGETVKSVSRTLGWDTGSLVSLSQKQKGTNVSLDQSLRSNGLCDSPYENATNREFFEMAMQIMDQRLKPKKSEAIRLYYLEHAKLSEIANIQGVSQSRVCKEIKEGLAHLRLCFLEKSGANLLVNPTAVA